MMRAYIAAVTCMIGIASTVAAIHAQDRRAVRMQTGEVGVRLQGGALSDLVVANAPFSADAVTTVTQTLADGTRIEQRTTAKWYRDSSGRMRREQTVIGLDRLNPSAQPQTTISFDSVPGDPQPYTLNPATKTARRGPRGLQWFTLQNFTYQSSVGLSYFRTDGTTANAPRELSVSWLDPSSGLQSALQVAAVPADAQRTEEQLGTRQVEGVKAMGRRKTTVIPAGRIGNDRAIQIVEEQWESPELNMVITSRFSDPRTGVVEYRMTNITRTEPRADLFAVPPDYTVADPMLRYNDALAPGAAPQPVQRGQRGGRGN